MILVTTKAYFGTSFPAGIILLLWAGGKALVDWGADKFVISRLTLSVRLTRSVHCCAQLPSSLPRPQWWCQASVALPIPSIYISNSRLPRLSLITPSPLKSPFLGCYPRLIKLNPLASNLSMVFCFLITFVCGGQGTARGSQFSPLMWILETKFRSLGLVAFTESSHSAKHWFFFLFF